MVTTVKKLDSKLQIGQQLSWPKISNMKEKKKTMIKSLENYDGKVQNLRMSTF